MTFKAVKITQGKAMNQARLYFGITYGEVKKEVYVFGGGYCNDYLNHCEKFCTQTNEWIDIAPMKEKKWDASACILNNQFIFVIGGYNNGG